MKGFKNSTRTQYTKGGDCDGYAKGGSVKGAAKISKVMGEFKRGELHSGSKKGPEVTSSKQATAIALSEARKAGAKIPQPVQKKSLGGVLKALSPVAMLADSEVGKGLMGAGVFGLGGLLLNEILKKKQSGAALTPAEQQKLDTAQAQQGAAPQTAMKKGGPVKKNHGGMMREGTSARPVKVGPTPEEGAARAAVARGNRMQALEAKEDAKLMREGRKTDLRPAVRPPEMVRVSKAVPPTSMEPKIRNPLMDRLSRLPSQRGEFPVRRAGGGLAAKPKGGKC